MKKPAWVKKKTRWVTKWERERQTEWIMQIMHMENATQIELCHDTTYAAWHVCWKKVHTIPRQCKMSQIQLFLGHQKTLSLCNGDSRVSLYFHCKFTLGGWQITATLDSAQLLQFLPLTDLWWWDVTVAGCLKRCLVVILGVALIDWLVTNTSQLAVQTLQWVQDAEEVEARKGQVAKREENQAPGDSKQTGDAQQGAGISLGSPPFALRSSKEQTSVVFSPERWSVWSHRSENILTDQRSEVSLYLSATVETDNLPDRRP